MSVAPISTANARTAEVARPFELTFMVFPFDNADSGRVASGVWQLSFQQGIVWYARVPVKQCGRYDSRIKRYGAEVMSDEENPNAPGWLCWSDRPPYAGGLTSPEYGG
jgi:hypothetical protein